jgi:hypothetical protein
MGGRAAHDLADDLAGALPALRSPQARPSPRAAITLPSPPDRPMLSACGGVGDGMRPGEGGGLALPVFRKRQGRRQPPTIGIDERPSSSTIAALN